MELELKQTKGKIAKHHPLPSTWFFPGQILSEGLTYGDRLVLLSFGSDGTIFAMLSTGKVASWYVFEQAPVELKSWLDENVDL